MTTATATSPGAVVIGGDYRGLGVVRNLGRHGVPVWVLKNEHAIATFSRYALRSLPWPDESDGDERRVAFLLDLSERYPVGGWSLIPTTDEAAALLEHHHTLLAERFRLTTATWEAMRWAYDKRLTHRLAADVGVDQPWTMCPRDREEVVSLSCTFPVILKPAVKTSNNQFTYARAWQVNDHDALLRLYDQARTMVDPDVIMVQELIPGGPDMRYSFAAVCKDGHPRGWMVTRAVRQYPLDFSRFSTYVETVDEPEVEEAGRRLVAAIGYTGIVQIQFKRDPRDGRHKLLDINPRVFGSHSIGPGAGVDFSYLLWQLSQGYPIPEVRARPGVRWVRMVGDALAAVKEMSQGTLSPGAYLGSLRPPLEYAIFAPEDPIPALVDIPLLVWMAWKQRAVARRTSE
jgi:D-aspartate ligase